MIKGDCSSDEDDEDEDEQDNDNDDDDDEGGAFDLLVGGGTLRDGDEKNAGRSTSVSLQPLAHSLGARSDTLPAPDTVEGNVAVFCCRCWRW